jgi:CBS domain-containing protein
MSTFVDAEKHPVVTLPSNCTLRDALLLMLGNRITGVPVVDPESGEIIANVSLSDVRKLGTAHSAIEFEGLLETNVLEYLRRKSGDSAAPSLSPLVLHKDDSLGTAIELLASSMMCVSPWFSVSLLKSKWLSSRDVGRWCNG